MDLVNISFHYLIPSVFVILAIFIFYNRKDPEQIAAIKEKNRRVAIFMDRYYWRLLKFSIIVVAILVAILYIYFFFVK